MNILWLVRGVPDLDNISPIIYKLLIAGYRIEVVLDFDDPSEILTHPILKFLDRSEAFFIVNSLNRKSPYCQIMSYLDSMVFDMLICDWGEGIPHSLLHRAVYFLRSRKISYRQKWLMAAKSAGLRLVAFPHGYNTRIDIKTKSNNVLRSVLNRLNISMTIEDYSDRSIFDLYIFNNQYYREVCTKYYKMSKVSTEVIGPFKYSQWWLDVLSREVYSDLVNVTREKDNDCELRMAFFIPKWANNVNMKLVDEFVERLQSFNKIKVFFQKHPRKGVSEPTDVITSAIENIDSFSLSCKDSRQILYEVDLVIDFGSSIALDALVQGIPVIYPVYTQSNTSILSDLPGVYELYSYSDLEQVVHQVIEKKVDIGLVSDSLGVVQSEEDIEFALSCILLGS